MMRARLTYIPVEVADHFEDFIIKRDEQVLDAVRAKTRDFSTLSLLKLLYQVRGGPMTFSDLYSKSKIRMKRSFLNYLHLCLDYNFVKSAAPHFAESIMAKYTELRLVVLMATLVLKLTITFLLSRRLRGKFCQRVSLLTMNTSQ